MTKKRAEEVAGVINGVIVFKVQRKNETLAQATVRASDEINITLEEAEEVIKEAESCLQKGSIDNSYFDTKYYRYRYSKENREKIKNRDYSGPFSSIPRNELRPWDDIARKLHERIEWSKETIENAKQAIEKNKAKLPEIEKQIARTTRQN